MSPESASALALALFCLSFCLPNSKASRRDSTVGGLDADMLISSLEGLLRNGGNRTDGQSSGPQLWLRAIDVRINQTRFCPSFEEKAELVESHVERSLRAERARYPYPLVIRLLTYIKIPPRLSLPVTRRWVLRRDGYTCQYCGRVESELTIDHVLPFRAAARLFGPTSWPAVCPATARRLTTRRRGQHAPAYAAFQASLRALALVGSARENEIWARYLLTD